MSDIQLGKIQSVKFGIGGYNDAEIGVWFTLGGAGWGVGTGIRGGWASFITVTEFTKWTEAERTEQYANMVREVQSIMRDAKVSDISALLNIPVECVFERGTLTSWRVLKEVI